MSDETQHNGLNDPLALLRRLDPQPVHLDRDRFFFSAGEASARGEIRHSRRFTAIWPAAAAALALVCAILGLQIARMSDDLAHLPIRSGGMVTQETDEPDAGTLPIFPLSARKIGLSPSPEAAFEKGDILLFSTTRESRPLRAGDRHIDLSRWTPLTDHTSTDFRPIRADEQEKPKTYLEIRNELSST
jgi:hypothetical protein